MNGCWFPQKYGIYGWSFPQVYGKSIGLQISLPVLFIFWGLFGWWTAGIPSVAGSLQRQIPKRNGGFNGKIMREIMENMGKTRINGGFIMGKASINGTCSIAMSDLETHLFHLGTPGKVKSSTIQSHSMDERDPFRNAHLLVEKKSQALMEFRMFDDYPLAIWHSYWN